MKEPILGWPRILALLVVVPAAWLYVWTLSPAQADSLGFRAVALVCLVGVEGPDCLRDNALDIAMQPVAHETECGLVGQVLASHLTLRPGERHKIGCERRG